MEEGKSPIYTSEVSIKVIDIAKSLVIAEVEPQLGKSNQLSLAYGQFEKLVNEITYVYYDENNHEIITGHEDGSLVIWF